MKVSFISPAHSDKEEPKTLGTVEITESGVKTSGKGDFAEYNAEVPGRVDLKSLTPEQALLWMRGIVSLTGSVGLIAVSDDPRLSEELTDEELEQLEAMVGGDDSDEPEAKPAVPQVPNRLKRK